MNVTTRLVASAACFFAVTLAAPAARAKSLYITVNRAFAPTEQPALDVAFAQKQPVELRVLRPKNLELYIDAQENLRRSWERPALLANPGRALSRGYNNTRAPGTYLLLALDVKMREALGAELAPRTQAMGSVATTLDDGEKKLIGIPSDMELVSSQWLNLDLGGAQREFNVPGFEGWSSTSSGFEERRVLLKPLPVGVYIIQLVQGQTDGQVVLVVTDLSVAVKQTDGRALVRVADRTQRAVEGADVTIKRIGKPPLRKKTDAFGEAWFDTRDARLVVLTQRPDATSQRVDTAIVDTDFYSTLAASPDVFMYTDRPIYRAGDVVKFRGIVRRPDGFFARLFSTQSTDLRIELVPVAGDPVAAVKTKVTLDDNGSFTGEFDVPASQTDGVMRVLASLDNHQHTAELRVQEYVKPTFFLEVATDSETVVPGSSIKASIKAERYSGGPPLHTAYEVTVTRSTVDAPAWVDDAGLGGTGSAVTYGSASTSEGKLSVPDRVYSSLALRLDAGSASYDDTWASAPAFDDKGTAHIEVEIPALTAGEERIPYKYTLTVRARDDQGSFAASSVPLFLSPVDVMGALRLSKKVQMVGQPVMLTVRSTTLSGKPMGKVTGELRFAHQSVNGDEREVARQAFVTDDNGSFSIAAPTQQAGSVVVSVTLADKKGARWSGEERALVVGTAGEAVQWVPELSLTSTTDVVEPNEKAEVVALLPDEWGADGKAAGPVWVTLSGTSLFSTKVIAAKGQTLVIPFDVERRFGSAVYVSVAYPTRSGRWEERTAAFRVVPRERVLSIALEPAAGELLPLTEQSVHIRVTDSSGRGVRAQLSLGVVDKAIYAVQAEFRPNVVDFFYPLVRNNVATFTSAEFQGYGYGHLLAQRAMDAATRFAAIKPPKKKSDERDTAYFNGDIRTDAGGDATVTFRLPSNQTLWTVTAVAADAKGRVGEGVSEFATRGKGGVSLSLPQRLRIGDEVDGVVRLSRPDKDKGSVLSLSSEVAGPITALMTANTADLSSAREATVPIKLKATAQGLASVSLTTTGGGLTFKDKKSVPVSADVLRDHAAVSRDGAGTLELTVSPDAQTTDVALVLQSTLADAALADLRELVVYPYGCLEQLVATTTPSLALMAALQAQGRIDVFDTDTQGLLLEARSRAQQGVQLILQKVTASGGFSWYGTDDPSVEMTLLGLGAVATAVSTAAVNPKDPRIERSVRFLEAQDLDPALDSWRTYVLARIDGKRAAGRVRATLAKAGVGSALDGALAVLAAQAAHLDAEAGLADAVRAQASRAKDALLSSNAGGDDDWRYRLPLGEIGVRAILADAARAAGGDDGRVAAKVLALYTHEELSTLDRATLLLHTLPFVTFTTEELKTMPAPTVNGAPAGFTVRGSGLVLALPAGTRSVAVGAFSGIATLTATVLTPSATAPAVSDGFVLQRAYYSVGSGVKRALGVGESIRQGDIVYVELTMDLRGAQPGRSAYTVVEDAVPAGFTALQEDKGYRAAPLSLPLSDARVRRRAFQTERVSFFIESDAWWMGTPQVLGYVMRADFVGSFSAPAATAQDMYNVGARARTTPTRLSIVASQNGR